MPELLPLFPPVAAHETVGLVNIADTFFVIYRHNLTDFSRIDDILDCIKQVGIP